MASQLVGNCVVFHVAFVGPSQSGKTTFIDRWHDAQSIGSAEAAASKFQRELILMKEQELKQKERHMNVISSSTGSGNTSRRMSMRAASVRSRQRTTPGSGSNPSSSPSSRQYSRNVTPSPSQQFLPTTSSGSGVHQRKNQEKQQNEAHHFSSGLIPFASDSEFINSASFNNNNNNNNKINQKKEKQDDNDDNDNGENETEFGGTISGLSATLNIPAVRNEGGTGAERIARRSSSVLFRNQEYDDDDNYDDQHPQSPTSSSPNSRRISRHQSMIDALTGSKSVKRKESKNLSRRASIVMQLQAQEMFENSLKAKDNDNDNHNDIEDTTSVLDDKSSFGSSKFGSWPGSESQQQQRRRRSFAISSSSPNNHQNTDNDNESFGSGSLRVGGGPGRTLLSNDSRRSSASGVLSSSPFGSSQQQQQQRGGRNTGTITSASPHSLINGGDGESSALSSHRSSLSLTIGSSSQAQLHNAQSAMITAAREAAEHLQRVDEAIAADEEYKRLYREQKRKKTLEKQRRKASFTIGEPDNKNKANNTNTNLNISPASSGQTSQSRLMRRKSSVKIATIEDQEDEDDLMKNDDDDNNDENQKQDSKNTKSPARGSTRREQRELDIVSLIRRRSGMFNNSGTDPDIINTTSSPGSRKSSFVHQHHYAISISSEQQQQQQQLAGNYHLNRSSNYNADDGSYNYQPTIYSRFVRTIATLPHCASAAVHRMFLYDTPGDAERFSIPAALLSGKSLSFRLNGVVVCVDGVEMKRDPQVAKQVTKLMELCERFGLAALVIHRGASIPDDFPRRDDARTMFISCDEDDFEQSAHAFTKFLSQLHEIELNAKKLDVRRVDIQKEQVIEHVKRPKELIPTMKRLRIETSALPLEDCATTNKSGTSAKQQQQQQQRSPILVALIGAAASGKSTLLSSLVDDFILSHYEPTERLETGSCSLVGDEGPTGWRRNVVLLEGPLHDVFTRRPDVGVIFVDASSLGAIVEAAACVNEIEGLYQLPRCLCIIITKQSIDDFVSLEEVSAWAGDVGAYMAGYLDTRNKKANEEFFLSLMASFLNDLEIEEQKKIRDVQLSISLPEASAPPVSVSLSSLFSSSLPPSSSSMMTKKQKRHRRRFDERKQTADLINHGLHQQKLNQFEYFKRKQEEEEEYQKYVKNRKQQRVGSASDGANDQDDEQQQQEQQKLEQFHKAQQKTTDFLIKRLRNPAAYDKIEKQFKALQFIRQTCASLPMQTTHKQNEIDSGTFARSLRQSFDRRDPKSTGYITKKDAEELLQPFDPAEMFSMEEELKKVCASLPSAANAHGFVNFDQFCAAVCRVAGRT